MAKNPLTRSFFDPFFRFPQLFEEDFKEKFYQEMTDISIYEDDQFICVEVPLAGFKKENIDISFENGLLWIKAEKTQEDNDKERKYYCKSISSYSRRITIPGHYDESKDPQASFENGILLIQFPKGNKHQTKKISLK